MRDRFSFLEKKFKEKNREEEKASDISPEETPLNSLLEEMVEKSREADVEFAKISIEQKDKADAEKSAAAEMRN